MGDLRITIDSPETATSLDDGLRLKANDSLSLGRVGDLIVGIASGAKLGKVRVNTGPVKASGTVTFSSIVADDTVTINGVVHTGKNSPSGEVQFTTGVSDEDSANSLASKINASTTAKIVGVVAAHRRGTAALSTCVEDDTLTVNGITFTAKDAPTSGSKTEFGVGTTDSETAENLKAVVERAALEGVAGLVGIEVSRSTATLTFNYKGSLTLAETGDGITVANKVIVITSLVGGQAGNLCTLAISAHGSVSGAALTGGTEGTQYIFAQNYSAL